MTPDERNEVRELAMQIGKELGGDSATSVMRFFETTDLLQKRLHEMMKHALTFRGFIGAINEAQAACQDFLISSQAFAATTAQLGRRRRPAEDQTS